LSRVGSIPVLALCVCATAAPLQAAQLASGTITINGSEAITGPNRVSRDGIAASIAAPKSFPGTLSCSGGTCYFRTVIVTPTHPFVIVTITGGTNGTNVFAVGYFNSFSASALATNYLGDGGSSVGGGLQSTFSVTVPPGDPFVLAVGSVGASFGTVSYDISDSATIPVAPGLQAMSSRKTHNSAGIFDLPLTP
jgi:hypothetical protein